MLMADLEGFTAMSETLARDELIALLNTYFDALGAAVRERGGEILKFIGDALLAIFPVSQSADASHQCREALAAVRTGLEILTRDAPARVAAGLPPIRFGAALHLGDAMYGNIGTSDRLDFTVIGPAVNLVARLESLTRTLGEPVLLSSAFASACGLPVRPMGTHRLKGLAEPVPVFAPG
jgi:class 3 adenylate cyclase